MIKQTILAAALAVSATQFAAASSDGAWNALFARANGTCIGPSG
ncbi:hypothetical protein ACC719_11485 [Rhizobium ruizarguesonis]